MRLSDIEVKVKSPGGSLFHEVLDPNTGSVYVVASPGSLFEIHVIASPNNFFGGGPGGRLFLARCSVDGRELGHSVVLSARHPALKFVGFVREGNSKSITYDLFKFAAATPDDGTSQAESLEFKEGSIIITISEVVDLGQTEIEYNIAQSKDLQNGAKVPSLPEGKKFFLAPSLTTASGGAHKTSGFSNTKYGMLKANIAIFTLRYETPSTLLLRQILRRDNPVHAAILDSFPETRQQQPQPQASVVGSITTQPRIKRERASGSPEVIDLAGPSRVLPQAEPLAPGEELVCDLTAEEDAPRWAKRQAK